jgi:23S rRNA pseudouridine2605 synthase
MSARTILNRGVTTSLRLGRGTADRVVSVAGPRLGRLTDQVMARVRRTEPAATTTFTPSKRPAESAPEAPPAPAPRSAGPSPASVARNIAPQRPTAKPVRAAKPKSVPGAKLPPPRPSAS